MSKVPCGGFELDESLTLNNGKLGLAPSAGGGFPSGGTPYQYLVTDGVGNTKWEDRLAYDYSKVAEFLNGAKFVKVSDEVPSWATVDAPIKVWESDGTNITENPEGYFGLGGGSFITNYAGFITTDNLEFNGTVFPEKGVYFAAYSPEQYVTGIASAGSDTPEITWDGNVAVIKKLDEKFLPEPLILYTH